MLIDIRLRQRRSSYRTGGSFGNIFPIESRASARRDCGRKHANLIKSATLLEDPQPKIASSLNQRPAKENSMSDPKKCAHASCTCMTTEKYCSTYCEENKDTIEITCKCGHAGCETEIA
jgi:hypothetical protein